MIFSSSLLTEHGSYPINCFLNFPCIFIIMELLEAIESRKSIRAFEHRPVSEQTLMEILKLSIRAPSGVNLQPWEFYVVTGDALEKLKRANLEAYRQGKMPEPELPVGDVKGIAPALEGVYRERQVELALQIFRIMGITKGDKKRQEEWNESMIQFYDAPAVIIAASDKTLKGGWPILDMGFVVQNILLAAQEYGLGTCVMRAIVDHPGEVRKIVGIPESKLIIVGIAIGYPDWDHPINSLVSNREEIKKIVTMVD